MKHLFLAAAAIGSLVLGASPADAHGYSSFSITIGNGYGYYPYGYGYTPYRYVYYPTYGYYGGGYGRYYDPWYDRRYWRHHHHRHHYRYRYWDDRW